MFIFQLSVSFCQHKIYNLLQAQFGNGVKPLPRPLPLSVTDPQLSKKREHNEEDGDEEGGEEGMEVSFTQCCFYCYQGEIVCPIRVQDEKILACKYKLLRYGRQYFQLRTASPVLYPPLLNVVVLSLLMLLCYGPCV